MLRGPGSVACLLSQSSFQIPVLQLSLSASALRTSFECHLIAMFFLISLFKYRIVCIAAQDIIFLAEPIMHQCQSEDFVPHECRMHFFEPSKPFVQFGLNISCRLYSNPLPQMWHMNQTEENTIKKYWVLYHLILSPLQQLPTPVGHMDVSIFFSHRLSSFLEGYGVTRQINPCSTILSLNASVNTDQFSGRSTTHFKSIFIQKTCVRETTLNTACNQIFFLIQLCVICFTYTSFSSLTLIIVVNVTPLLSSVIYLHSSVKE